MLSNLDLSNLGWLTGIAGVLIALAIAAAVDFVRRAPARKLDRLVRLSKGRWQ